MCIELLTFIIIHSRIGVNAEKTLEQTSKDTLAAARPAGLSVSK
jgi:hypothetical protein